MSDRDFLRWPFFTPAHAELVNTVEDWCKANLGEADHAGDHFERAPHLVQQLGRSGILKYAVISPYGGNADRLDIRSICLIRETLARFDGLADFAFAMQGLGSAPVSLFGSADQKERYLPHIAMGSTIGAFALSEALAGSDVGSIATAARLRGDKYILDGEKTWISNAGLAGFYVVFARTADSGAKGLSAFVVEPTFKGFHLKNKIDCISPHPLGTIQFRNCEVPVSNRLGAEGEGFKIAMSTLDYFRSSVGAAALGFGRRALDEAVAQVRTRRLFNQSLADFQMTQAAVADMALKVDAAALLIYRAAWCKDCGGSERITREAAMAKLYATEAAQEVIDRALQLFGGQGVVSGSILERLYRDIRPLRIYEGTSEIQKIIIANQVLK
ncbi:MAG: acyl-CoA dehydrogenase family protein [Oligoflexia bacterium]|nr:acyl-CoA dehydrogenase family protein [Oligoflexia bacterium]